MVGCRSSRSAVDNFVKDLAVVFEIGKTHRFAHYSLPRRLISNLSVLLRLGLQEILTQ
jgi:hypothetical protein